MTSLVLISASQVPSTAANSIQVMKVCQAFTQLGCHVHLLVPGAAPVPWESLADHYGLQARFELEWLPVHPGLHRYDFSLNAVRRARALKADAVYVWPLQAALAALIQRMPVLLELHAPPEGRLGPALFRWFCKLKGKKRLLPITEALVHILERSYPHAFDPEQVVVSPDGVDLERYRDLPDAATARRQLGFSECLTAGYTGHLYPGRGLSLLLELAQNFPAVQFLWIGGRSEHVTEWRQRLADEKIANVHLTGFVENSRLGLYQAAADVLLMPYERVITGSSGGNTADFCSPMKMFEYMACGRAILSSDLPVLREVLNESNAVLCPPEDVRAWTSALKGLLEDQGLRSRLASQAREDVQAYSWIERAKKSLAGFLPTPEAESKNG